MRIVKFFAIAGLAVAGLPSLASAQEDSCACVAREGSAGRFVAANGSVLASGISGYGQAVAGTPISSGSEISVGANSSAEIQIGNCALQLSANTVTRLSALANRNICVASNEAATGGLAGNYIAPGMFLGLAGGAAALALTNGDNVGQGTVPVSP